MVTLCYAFPAMYTLAQCLVEEGDFGESESLLRESLAFWNRQLPGNERIRAKSESVMNVSSSCVTDYAVSRSCP